MLWKALSEEEKKPYEADYQQHKEQYMTEVAAWKEAKGISADAKDEDDDEEEEEKGSPQKADAKKASPKKRAAKDKAESPAAKKAKGKDKAKEGPNIPAEIIEKAKKANLDGALTNLASRQDITEKNISADKLLDALEKSGGLVNKAKAILLGA